MIRHLRVATLAALAATCSLAGLAAAQQLDLPRPSPNAKVTQSLGLTDVTVDYSCPGVKGRAVWGTVVPYDKLWRTGANSATKVTFSKDATVGDKAVPAGTYSLFTIPGKASWTVILNRNATASTDEYKQADDLLRLTVTPTAIAPRERLAFVFSDFGDAGGNLDLEWEKLRVSIPIKVSTDAQAQQNLTALASNAWRPWNAGARYLLENKKSLDQDQGPGADGPRRQEGRPRLRREGQGPRRQERQLLLQGRGRQGRRRLEEVAD